MASSKQNLKKMARYSSRIIPSTSNTDNGSRWGMSLGIKELKQVSAVMADKLGVPYSQIPLSFLKRRLSFLFQKHNIQNAEAFISLLDDTSYLNRFFYDFSVATTELFRDPGFWRDLKPVLHKISYKDNIKVWFPHVSTGEEVFSFLILIHELGMVDRFQVVCQHPSRERLNEIKAGQLFNKNLDLYQKNYIRLEVGHSLETYYTVKNNQFFLNPDLLKKLEVKQGHFYFSEPPAAVGLVFYRNNMLYYEKELAAKCSERLLDSLLPGGIIALGSKERLPESEKHDVVCLSEKDKLYRKNGFEISINNE
jgi:chemotaxis protein methyltransferase CheR